MEHKLDSDSVAEKNRARMKAALLSDHRNNRSLPSELSGTTDSSASTPEAVRPVPTSGSFSQLNLERKHSYGDLTSRLKTRKLLGVGETSGEIHRSKISQLLGHSEHLFTRYPLGFWYWYRALLVQYSLAGFWKIALGQLIEAYIWSWSDPDGSSKAFEEQTTGVLYLGLAMLLGNFYQSYDKLLIRFILNVVSLISVLRIALLLINFYPHLTWLGLAWLPFLAPLDMTCCKTSPIYLTLDVVTVLVNLYYQHRMSQPNNYSAATAHHHQQHQQQQQQQGGSSYQRQLSGGSSTITDASASLNIVKRIWHKLRATIGIDNVGSGGQ